MLRCLTQSHATVSSISISSDVATLSPDLLSAAADSSTEEVTTMKSPSRLENAASMHQLRVASPRSPPLDSPEVVLASFSRDSSTFSPPYDHADPLSVFDVAVSAAVVDIHRTLARIDQQTQRREIDLVRLVSSLLDTPRLLLGASQLPSIRPANSLADLVTLANGDIVESIDHSDSVARLCVALAQSEQTSASCRR